MRYGKPKTMPAARMLGTGLFAGLLLALVTSAGLVAQRLMPGSLPVAAIAELVSALAAFGVLALAVRPVLETREARACWTTGASAMGAVLGIGAVHLALRATWIASSPWLSERPAQLVNDLVAVFGALAFVWGSIRGRFGALASLAGLGLTVVYAATAGRWHLDAVRGTATIQVSVLAQLAYTAVGLAILRRGMFPPLAGER